MNILEKPKSINFNVDPNSPENTKFSGFMSLKKNFYKK